MSQMTSFWNAMKACWKLSVFVKIVTVTARKAHAPVGKGSRTSPAAHGGGPFMPGENAVTPATEAAMHAGMQPGCQSEQAAAHTHSSTSFMSLSCQASLGFVWALLSIFLPDAGWQDSLWF